MTTRSIVTTFLYGSLLVFFSFGVKSQEIPDQRPNIIFLMADDVSAREFSCYGNTEIHTPFIDQLAGEGVLIDHCWATPICSPTRALVMTGKYGFRTGWFHNELKPKEYPLSDRYPVFSRLLKEGGYSTAICGKWQLPGSYEQHGFDEYCMWTGTGRADKIPFDGPVEGEELRGLPGTFIGRTARYWHPCIERNGTILDTGPDDYGPDIFVEFILDFARRNRANPFLVYFPMLLPHRSWDFDLKKAGYLPVPEMDENGNRTGGKVEGSLKSNVEYMDVMLKRIVKGLQKEGLWDNTILLFTGDNGTTGYGKGNVSEDRGPRVPMLFSSGKLVNARGKIDALMDFSDLLPTICDAAGVPLPEGEIFDGHSMMPVLRGEADDVREWSFSYYSDYRLLRDKRWLLDGQDRFYDCSGGPGEYKEVTGSTGPEVMEAISRFEQILEGLPGPTREQVDTLAFNNQGRRPPLKHSY